MKEVIKVDIYNDGKKVTTVETELSKLQNIKERVEDEYKDAVTAYVQTSPHNILDYYANEKLINVLSDILGYSYKKVTEDVDAASKRWG